MSMKDYIHRKLLFDAIVPTILEKAQKTGYMPQTLLSLSDQEHDV